MIRCRGCGKFAREDNFCKVCGKSPDRSVYGINPYTLDRWDDDHRRVWMFIVEMGVHNLRTLWER